MRYAILTSGNPNQIMAKYDSIGFYQWLNVFRGQLIPAGEGLADLKDGDYDLIHIRLSRENLALVHQLRSRLGPDSSTKIAVSQDIPVPYWEKEFARLDQLAAAAREADFITGAGFSIARALEEITGKVVYEIPHPADLNKIKAFSLAQKGEVVTVLYGRQVNVIRWTRMLRAIFGSNVKIRILSYRYEIPDQNVWYRKKKIDAVNCENERELCEKLAESRFILIPETRVFYGNEDHDYEKLVIYSAVMGAIVFGNNHLEAMRRCYSDMANTPSGNYLTMYWWLKDDAAKMKYLTENAQTKTEFYNWGNLQKRFLDRLYDETKDERFHHQELKLRHPALFEQIQPVHGPQTINYQREEFTVVCLVKNGAEYIKAFVGYYSRMGAKHFFFIDNSSTDETVKLLKQYPNITIYHTKLPHKNYECEIRRAVIEEHCRNNWCLCVDIDELFDYPYSDRISMRHFLRYLNSHHYTAVLSYLLDMFSRKLEFSPQGAPLQPKPAKNLEREYCYYDLTNLRKSRYQSSFNAFSNYNRLADAGMKSYSGGIRRSLFKNKESGYLLTKHPLIFVDSKIEPVVHPHYCNKAFVADVNGVLKHYKFISSFKEKVVRSLEAKDYCYYAEQEYMEYYKVIQDKDTLNLYSQKAEKLEEIEQLVDQGFLRISKAYRNYLQRMGTPDRRNCL